MTAVEVNHIVKSFSGKTAVNDLSFSVVPGEIVGLIGPLVRDVRSEGAFGVLPRACLWGSI